MRVGKKKQPTYRLVVADARSPRDGRFIEIIGQYRPRQEPSVVSVDSDRALHWLANGAQPTEQAAKILEISPRRRRPSPRRRPDSRQPSATRRPRSTPTTGNPRPTNRLAMRHPPRTHERSARRRLR
jgi:small subunit ribosomal protein S16